jgi:phage-related protein
VGGILAALAALSPMFSVLSGISGLISTLTGSMGGLSAVLGGISAPVIAAVAAVGLLVAAFVHLMQTNEEFRNTVTGIWSDIQARFASFGDNIVAKLNQMGGNFQSFSEVVRAVWDGLCSFLAPLMENAMNTVQSVIDHVLRAIEGIFDIFAGVFTGNWSQVWNGIKEVFSGVWGTILDIARSTLNTIIGLLNGVVGGINKVSAAAGKPANIPEIPMLANGGILSKGSAIVGEAGAELLTMVDGKAVVQPLTNNTNNYAGATNNFYIQSSDPEQVAEEVSTILNNQMQRMQGAWA